jgi:DnaK suppressor protein
MKATQLQDFRNRLLSELAAAIDAIRRAKSHDAGNFDLSKVPDEADAGAASHERDVHYSAGEKRSHRLKLIEAALERIDRGAYGVCLRCEDDIQPKRLMALPWTPLCIDCQAELENIKPFRTGVHFDRIDQEDDESLSA